jgi:hypothetical protein
MLRTLGAGALALKYAAASQYVASSANFFTTGALYGATADAVTAGVYVTVCDISGAGTLYNVVGPQITGTTAGTTSSIRVTTDGTVYTWDWTADTTVAATDRLVLGAVGAGTQINATADNIAPLGPNSQQDAGFVQLEGGRPYLPNPSLIAPYWFDMLNLPTAEFSTDLKVEVKVGTLGAAGVARSALATYKVL